MNFGGQSGAQAAASRSGAKRLLRQALSYDANEREGPFQRTCIEQDKQVAFDFAKSELRIDRFC